MFLAVVCHLPGASSNTWEPYLFSSFAFAPVKIWCTAFSLFFLFVIWLHKIKSLRILLYIKWFVLIYICILLYKCIMHISAQGVVAAIVNPGWEGVVCPQAAQSHQCEKQRLRDQVPWFPAEDIPWDMVIFSFVWVHKGSLQSCVSSWNHAGVPASMRKVLRFSRTRTHAGRCHCLDERHPINLCGWLWSFGATGTANGCSWALDSMCGGLVWCSWYLDSIE